MGVSPGSRKWLNALSCCLLKPLTLCSACSQSASEDRGSPARKRETYLSVTNQVNEDALLNVGNEATDESCDLVQVLHDEALRLDSNSLACSCTRFNIELRVAVGEGWFTDDILVDAFFRWTRHLEINGRSRFGTKMVVFYQG